MNENNSVARKDILNIVILRPRVKCGFHESSSLHWTFFHPNSVDDKNQKFSSFANSYQLPCNYSVWTIGVYGGSRLRRNLAILRFFRVLRPKIDFLARKNLCSPSEKFNQSHSNGAFRSIFRKIRDFKKNFHIFLKPCYLTKHRNSFWNREFFKKWTWKTHC